jgi:hypothetical protein
MRPIRILREYMKDVKMQQKVALKGNNIEDAEEMQNILDEFEFSIKLIQYWQGEKLSIKRLSKAWNLETIKETS